MKRLRTKTFEVDPCCSIGVGSSMSTAHVGRQNMPRTGIAIRSNTPSCQTRAAAQTISRLFSLRWTTVRLLKLRMVNRGMSFGAVASVLANGETFSCETSASSFVHENCASKARVSWRFFRR